MDPHQDKTQRIIFETFYFDVNVTEMKRIEATYLM